jgi:hypothetical protein
MSHVRRLDHSHALHPSNTPAWSRLFSWPHVHAALQTALSVTAHFVHAHMSSRMRCWTIVVRFRVHTSHVVRYVAPNGTSSWGMSVVKDTAGGMYHGFVSEFANGCKLGSWGSNSYVNHVVADTPTGPWRQVRSCRHNPL